MAFSSKLAFPATASFKSFAASSRNVVATRNSVISMKSRMRSENAEDDEQFVERVYRSGVAELRGRDLGRLRRCSIRLGELEVYM